MLEPHSCVAFCAVVAPLVELLASLNMGIGHSNFAPEGKRSNSSQILNISSGLMDSRSPQG